MISLRDVVVRVVIRHTILLKQRMYLKARFETQQPLDLRLRQRSGPIAFDRQRLQRVARHITPCAKERLGHVFW